MFSFCVNIYWFNYSIRPCLWCCKWLRQIWLLLIIGGAWWQACRCWGWLRNSWWWACARTYCTTGSSVYFVSGSTALLLVTSAWVLWWWLKFLLRMWPWSVWIITDLGRPSGFFTTLAPPQFLWTTLCLTLSLISKLTGLFSLFVAVANLFFS